MDKTNGATFTPRADLHFRGAVSGKPYHLTAWTRVQLDPGEVVHIDPKDLLPGVHEKPKPEPRTQGASIDD